MGVLVLVFEYLMCVLNRLVELEVKPGKTPHLLKLQLIRLKHYLVELVFEVELLLQS